MTGLCCMRNLLALFSPQRSTRRATHRLQGPSLACESLEVPGATIRGGGAHRSEPFVTRGFVGNRDRQGGAGLSGDERRRRTPPGQYLTDDFPVLSAGPTPRTALDRWSLRLEGLVDRPVQWSWE